MSDIQDIISDLCKKYEQRYGFAVFDLRAQETDKVLILQGKVLTHNQKAQLLKEAGRFGKEIKEEIEVLSDPAGQGIGWAEVTAAAADQKVRFVSNSIINDKILRRIRASQLKKGDIIRVLLRKEDQILGQAGDLTLGWTDLKDVEMKEGDLRKSWTSGIRARAGELVLVSGSAEELIAEAERFLGTPYLLGARSEAAIDCSGFTQFVYRNAFDVVLPKHSWDQKEMGVAVEREEAQTGDLVFLINKKKGTKHVGIWEKAEDGDGILHASFSAGKVLKQKAEEVLEEYELIEIRRIIKK